MVFEEFPTVFMDTFTEFGRRWKALLLIAFYLGFLPMALLGVGYNVYIHLFTTSNAIQAVGELGTITEALQYFVPFIVITVVYILALGFFGILLAVSLLEALKANLDAKAAIRAGLARWPSAFALYLVMGIALFFLFLALIIPGIIFCVIWAFALVILVREDKKALEAMSESRKVVRNRWWNVALSFLIFFLVLGLGQWIIYMPFFFLILGLNFVLPLAGSIVETIVTAVTAPVVTVLSLLFTWKFYHALKESGGLKSLED